jgi:hypothetical protein
MIRCDVLAAYAQVAALPGHLIVSVQGVRVKNCGTILKIGPT